MTDGTSSPDARPEDQLAALLSFGVNLGRVPGEAPANARWAQEAGFDVVTAADHLGSVSPFVMLAAAAAVTQRVRLRTYVLDFGFWNPALLARDAATLDVLSDGRLDLGVGGGNMRHEHEAAGLPFPPFAERMAALDAFVAELRRRLDAADHLPRPVQRPVPVFVAAMSDAGVDVAARHGDLVALSGLYQVKGRPAGTLMLAGSAATDDRVARVQAARAAAGRPPARLDALLQQVVVDRDPQQVADEWAAEPDARSSAADVLDSPFVLLASSPREAAAELLRRARRWGITSWCTHAASGPALAEVIAALRG
jgi:probable F420-dependent oxidoreductase